MGKYKCIVCEYIHDEAKNDVPWQELSEDWLCPAITTCTGFSWSICVPLIQRFTVTPRSSMYKGVSI